MTKPQYSVNLLKYNINFSNFQQNNINILSRGDFLSVIIVMSIGWFIGYKYFKEKYIKANSFFQTVCVALLIFCMGVSLGSRPTFFDDLKDLGINAVIYSVVPIIFSVVFVYFLTEITINRKGGQADDSNSDD